MASRLFVGGLLCALLCGIAYALAALSPPALQRAIELQGERWYKLELDHEHVGYLYSRAWRDHMGDWHFSTDLRFVLVPGQPIAILDDLAFSTTPPYELSGASHESRRRAQTQRVAINKAGDGYRARLTTSGQTSTTHTISLDWTYKLSDYLAFETWLHAQRPNVGTTKTVQTLDLERLTVISKNHRIVGQNALGYEVENPALQTPTRIQLDASYSPVNLQMAGLFSLTRTSEELALAPRTALQWGSYHIPADRRIANHQQIQRLVLGVESSSDPTLIWPQLERHGDAWKLRLQANPVTAQSTAGTTSESARFPTSNMRVRRLAAQAVTSADDKKQQVAALTQFVNGYITYKPGTPNGSVLEIIERPVGDCTEFADLFTTLARSLGIPARTVFGMAYADDQQPTFAFHAWNEVAIDGIWQAVDPTWNQVLVDATHIPLPADSATLQLITAATDLRFTVDSIEYFSR